MPNKYIGLIVLIIFTLYLSTFREKKDYRTPSKKAELKDSQFIEMAQKLNITHHHNKFNIHEKLSNTGKFFQAIGGGVAAYDFNSDGLIDLFYCTGKQHSRNYLYKNNGDGSFTDVTNLFNDQAKNTDLGTCLRPIFFDINGDDLVDLFISTTFCHRLYKQNPNGTFSNISESSGVGTHCFSAPASNIIDYDRDGDMDIVIAGYQPKVDFNNPHTTLIMANSMDKANNGGPTVLLENMGNDKFIDRTTGLNLPKGGWNLALGVYDLNKDNWPDLWFAIDYNKSKVFLNTGKGSFKEQKGAIGEVYSHSSMNIDFSDLFHDQKLAAYVTQIYFPGTKISGNQIFFYSDKSPMLNKANELSVNQCGWSWGAKFIDLNNDSYDDLLVANGFISNNPDKKYWYDMMEILASPKQKKIDSKSWKPMADYSLAGFQQNCIFINTSTSLQRVAEHPFSQPKKDSRAIARIDYDNNGSSDIIVTNFNDRSFFYKNEIAPHNNWIGLKLIGPRYNRDALGTKIRLVFKNNKIIEKQAYYNNGFMAQSDHRIHFGLGKYKLSKINIDWPDGFKQELKNFNINSYNRIKYERN